jgi:hypothetical protein
MTIRDITVVCVPGCSPSPPGCLAYGRRSKAADVASNVARALVDCPVCQFPTRRIHSRYVRMIADLPWGPWRIVLHLHVRKFFCVNGRCSRRIFTERLAPWARHTQRLVYGLAHVAMALGGRAGVRLSSALGLPSSRHTLLRLLRRSPAGLSHTAGPLA